MILLILDTLDDFCLTKDRNPQTTYVWMCCLCINQHRVMENKTNMNSEN